MSSRTAYEILGVRHDAPDVVIRAAYKALSQRHHPDRDGSAEIMSEINDAYAILSDSALRKEYDSRINVEIPDDGEGESTWLDSKLDAMFSEKGVWITGASLVGLMVGMYLAPKDSMTGTVIMNAALMFGHGIPFALACGLCAWIVMLLFPGRDENGYLYWMHILTYIAAAALYFLFR